ncbi:MAG: hypothetical protein IKU04_08790, partial [Bacteroidales bacterium]|nr:hypothetical protein [Bacteroidales bacterium]
MKGFHLGLRRLCSVLLGLVFFIAGMLKLMDPVGAGLVVEEYLDFLHLGGLAFAAKWLGVALALVETLTGAALIAGVWRKQTAAITSILTLGFTFLTLLLVIFNPEMDCGCFGEAVHLTHMQTFVKNLVLCLLCAGAFLPVRDYGRNRKSKVIAFCLVAVTVLLFTVMSLISVPLMDFTEFAPGASLAANGDEEYTDGGISLGAENDTKQEYFVIYEKNGQEGAFTLDNLPDSTWTFVRVENMETSISDYEKSMPVFYISDTDGNYYTDMLMDGRVMVLSIYDVPGFKDTGRTKQFLRDAEAAGFTTIAVAREPVPELNAYLSDFKKIIIFNRSNGGATYLADGEIICKWPVR